MGDEHGHVTFCHPGGEQESVFALGWKWKCTAAAWPKASPPQTIDTAVALLLMLFRIRGSRGDAYHALSDRNWLYTNKSVSLKEKKN